MNSMNLVFKSGPCPKRSFVPQCDFCFEMRKPKSGKKPILFDCLFVFVSTVYTEITENAHLILMSDVLLLCSEPLDLIYDK